MSLETGTYVQDLVPTNPPGTDKKAQGDDHLRLIKTVLKNSFPNLTRPQYFARSRGTAVNGNINASDMAALVVGDSTSASISLSLPTLAAGDDGWYVVVVKSDGTANTVTVTGTVNGVSNFVLARQFEAGIIQWTGAGWVGFRHRPTIGTTDLVNNAVTNAILRDSAALSVIGNPTNATTDPSDIVAASDGLVLLRSGTTLAFGQVTGLGIANGAVDLAQLTGNGKAFQAQCYHIRAEFANGSDGGTLSTATWNTRELNTEKRDDIGITTTTNVISLPAGTWWCRADAVTHFIGQMDKNSGEVAMSKLRLRNTTDSVTVAVGLGQRMSILDDSGGNNENADFTLLTTMDQGFTIAGTKSIELQNWTTCNFTAPTIKAGKAITSGEVEVHADLKLWKIG